MGVLCQRFSSALAFACISRALPRRSVLISISFGSSHLIETFFLKRNHCLSYSPGLLFHSTKGITTGAKAMAERSESIVVYVTVPNKETGSKLANGIITNKLAACVNQIPGVESTYWWQDKVETDSEILLIIKTRTSLLDALTAYVKQNHPYELPEVISLPITGGNPAYLKWIHDSTSSQSS